MIYIPVEPKSHTLSPSLFSLAAVCQPLEFSASRCSRRRAKVSSFCSYLQPLEDGKIAQLGSAIYVEAESKRKEIIDRRHCSMRTAGITDIGHCDIHLLDSMSEDGNIVRLQCSQRACCKLQ